jgi:hypothetical protein
MERIPVVSSVVAAIAYDDGSRELDVEFVGGSLYRYHDVPRDEVDGLLESRSPGRWMNSQIIPRYRCTWLRG